MWFDMWLNLWEENNDNNININVILHYLTVQKGTLLINSTLHNYMVRYVVSLSSNNQGRLLLITYCTPLQFDECHYWVFNLPYILPVYEVARSIR